MIKKIIPFFSCILFAGVCLWGQTQENTAAVAEPAAALSVESAAGFAEPAKEPAAEQSVPAASNIGTAFNFKVQSQPGLLIMDPSIELTFANRWKLNSITGGGFYYLADKMHFLYDVGLEFEIADLSIDVRYQDTASEFLFLPSGKGSKNGAAGNFVYKQSQELLLRLGAFYGNISTIEQPTVPSYWFTLQVFGKIYIDILNYFQYSVLVTVPKTVENDLETAAVDISFPFHLLGDTLTITPRLGYVQRSAVNASPLLDSFIYDFATFTTGSSKSGVQGNMMAAINIDWKYYPLEYLDITFIKGMYVGPFCDAGFFIAPEKDITAASASFTVGALYGFDFWNTLFEIRAGYRYDTESPFVFGFVIKSK